MKHIVLSNCLENGHSHNLSFRRKLLLLGVTLMLGASAFAAKPQESAKLFSPSLGMSDINEVFYDFEVASNGEDKNVTVNLYGLIFSDCAGLFEINSTDTTPGLQDEEKKIVGFEVYDSSGAGQRCVAEHKKQDHDCSNQNCVSISNFPGSSLKLHNKKENFEVKLFHQNPKKDRNRQAWVDFDPPVKYQGWGEQYIALLHRQVSQCRDTVESRKTARGAALTLGEMGEMTSNDVNEIMEKLTELDLKVLQDDLYRAKGSLAIYQATTNIISFCTENKNTSERCESDFCTQKTNVKLLDQCASGIAQKARMLSQRAGDYGGIQDAHSLISRAASLSGISKSGRSALADAEKAVDRAADMLERREEARDRAESRRYSLSNSGRNYQSPLGLQIPWSHTNTWNGTNTWGFFPTFNSHTPSVPSIGYFGVPQFF